MATNALTEGRGRPLRPLLRDMKFSQDQAPLMQSGIWVLDAGMARTLRMRWGGEGRILRPRLASAGPFSPALVRFRSYQALVGRGMRRAAVAAWTTADRPGHGTVENEDPFWPYKASLWLCSPLSIAWLIRTSPRRRPRKRRAGWPSIPGRSGRMFGFLGVSGR